MMRNLRRSLAITLLFGGIAILLSCENIFTSSVYPDSFKRDSTSLSQEQQATRAETALASGDPAEMESSLQSLVGQVNTPEALAEASDEVKNLVIDLAVGSSGVTEVATNVLASESVSSVVASISEGGTPTEADVDAVVQSLNTAISAGLNTSETAQSGVTTAATVLLSDSAPADAEPDDMILVAAAVAMAAAPTTTTTAEDGSVSETVDLEAFATSTDDAVVEARNTAVALLQKAQETQTAAGTSSELTTAISSFLGVEDLLSSIPEGVQR